jgi:hypothetical protein
MTVCIWKASQPSGNAKIGYKIDSPPWLMGSLDSGSHCIPQYAVFLFSFLKLNSLQIKSFQSLLLESVCAFILRAGSRTLSTWTLKFLHVSSVHHCDWGFLNCVDLSLPPVLCEFKPIADVCILKMAEDGLSAYSASSYSHVPSSVINFLLCLHHGSSFGIQGQVDGWPWHVEFQEFGVGI